MTTKLETRINKLEGKIMPSEVPDFLIQFVSANGKKNGGLYRYDGNNLVKIKEQAGHFDRSC